MIEFDKAGTDYRVQGAGSSPLSSSRMQAGGAATLATASGNLSSSQSAPYPRRAGSHHGGQGFPPVVLPVVEMLSSCRDIAR